jgi:hypothetical protein
MLKKYFKIILLALLLVAAYFLMNSLYHFNKKNTTATTENKNTNNTTSNIDQWKEYKDKADGFTIAYPSNLQAIPLDPDNIIGNQTPDGGVSFATRGPGTMGVKIYKKTPFLSLDEWFIQKNAEREILRKEKNIHIAGYEAMVTYYVSVMPDFEETFPNEKRTVFLKNGDLYEIWTKFYHNPDANEIVWNSFTFDK